MVVDMEGSGISIAGRHALGKEWGASDRTIPFIPDVPGMRALVASHFCDFLISSQRDVMAELRAVVGPGVKCRTT
jgi:hypothetical protein